MKTIATLILMAMFLILAWAIAQGLYSLAGIGVTQYQVNIPASGGGEYQLTVKSEEVER